MTMSDGVSMLRHCRRVGLSLGPFVNWGADIRELSLLANGVYLSFIPTSFPVLKVGVDGEWTLWNLFENFSSFDKSTVKFILAEILRENLISRSRPRLTRVVINAKYSSATNRRI